MKKIILLIAVVSTMVAANAQQVVNGTILNQNNKPVAGVEISIKNSVTKVSSDNNGNYTIEVPANSKVLTFSKSGFDTQDVEIKLANKVDVKLKYGDIDYLSLEDLIVYQDFYYSNNKKSTN